MIIKLSHDNRVATSFYLNIPICILYVRLGRSARNKHFFNAININSNKHPQTVSLVILMFLFLIHVFRPKPPESVPLIFAPFQIEIVAPALQPWLSWWLHKKYCKPIPSNTCTHPQSFELFNIALGTTKIYIFTYRISKISTHVL